MSMCDVCKKNEENEKHHLQNHFDKNDLETLMFYEFTIHHKLRASWARVCGLVDILNKPHSEDEKCKIKILLNDSLNEMDTAMREISIRLYKRRMDK